MWTPDEKLDFWVTEPSHIHSTKCGFCCLSDFEAQRPLAGPLVSVVGNAWWKKLPTPHWHSARKNPSKSAEGNFDIKFGALEIQEEVVAVRPHPPEWGGRKGGST